MTFTFGQTVSTIGCLCRNSLLLIEVGCYVISITQHLLTCETNRREFLCCFGESCSDETPIAVLYCCYWEMP